LDIAYNFFAINLLIIQGKASAAERTVGDDAHIVLKAAAAQSVDGSLIGKPIGEPSTD